MNELKNSLSPYLLQHKENPVHWKSWSQEVLTLAKELGKPILVSIGYSTCHWCHVMAHESFEDESVAAIMNDFFINIKIDREERPDLDEYFMKAVQFMGVSGGWPLNVFLTPELKPFFGGTYFPPEPKYGRPSWKQILISIHRAYIERSQDIEKSANAIQAAIVNKEKLNSSKGIESIQSKLVFEQLLQFADKENGGFGSSPKFPSANVLKFFIYYYSLSGETKALDHVQLSIDRMMSGGIYDHIGGAFSRYSVDSKWNIPHFEKMLYDHAAILEVVGFLMHYRNEVRYSFLIDHCIAFFEQHLSENGLYFSSIDADSEGEEGKFYSWTILELKSILKDNFEEFHEYFDLVPFENESHFVIVAKYLSLIENSNEQDYFEKRNKILESLTNNRSQRIWPSIDNKIILSWNGLMASTFVSLYFTTKKEKYLSKAILMVEALLQFQSLDGYLYRIKVGTKFYGFGFLEDYSILSNTLLNLYQATSNTIYLVKAKEFIAYIESEFEFKEGLFSNVGKNHVDSMSPMFDSMDHSIQNSNSLIAESYRILNLLENNGDYLIKSENMCKHQIAPMIQNPFSMASWFIPYFEIENGGLHIKSSKADTRFWGMCSSIYEINSSKIRKTELCFNNTCHILDEFEKENIVLQGFRTIN